MSTFNVCYIAGRLRTSYNRIIEAVDSSEQAIEACKASMPEGHLDTLQRIVALEGDVPASHAFAGR